MHQPQTAINEFDLRRTYARHWRASWGPTFADAMQRPRAVREMTEKAQETPAITRRPVSATYTIFDHAQRPDNRIMHSVDGVVWKVTPPDIFDNAPGRGRYQR